MYSAGDAMSDTPRTDALIYRKNTIEMQRHELLDLALALERELAEAKAEISATRRWVNNNMTFYDVEPDGPDVCTSGPNIPTLAGVSKRIWYHATDNQTVSLFSEVIDLRQWEGK
jgi:hypothetical protein